MLWAILQSLFSIRLALYGTIDENRDAMERPDDWPCSEGRQDRVRGAGCCYQHLAIMTSDQSCAM